MEKKTTKPAWEQYLNKLMKSGSTYRDGDDVFTIKEVRECIELAIEEPEKRIEELMKEASESRAVGNVFTIKELEERVALAVEEPEKRIEVLMKALIGVSEMDKDKEFSSDRVLIDKMREAARETIVAQYKLTVANTKK